MNIKTRSDIENILELHSKWLKGEKDGKRADFSDADLSGADFSNADLRNAIFCGANLSDANLCDANFSYSNLSGADFRGAKKIDVRYDANTSFFALQCPEEGSFVGWKKIEEDYIVKLLIPEDAKRSSATSRKCRASKAIVLEIYDRNGNVMRDDFIGHSKQNNNFIYRKGETVIPDSYDENRWNECSHGIHFFITSKEAELY